MLTYPAKPKPAAVLLLALSCCLQASCAAAGTSAEAGGGDGFTAEYRAFLAAREGEDEDAGALRVRAGGCSFTLDEGRLCVLGADDAELWRSKEEWYVDSFRIGDVNGDRISDIAFVVWKSYSFGAEHPARMANEDAAVRCHLFVYSVKDDKVRPLWCSSALPRPIYAFELTRDGEQTQVLSGTRLETREGRYTDDYSKTASSAYTYAWNAWGFSPES